jgi:hypothetical protein
VFDFHDLLFIGCKKMFRNQTYALTGAERNLLYKTGFEEDETPWDAYFPN